MTGTSSRSKEARVRLAARHMEVRGEGLVGREAEWLILRGNFKIRFRGTGRLAAGLMREKIAKQKGDVLRLSVGLLAMGLS